MGRLREYEFDELKIDRSFVGDLDTGDPTLVATQIAMAHGLGLGVVAEGVETAAQLEYLRNAGCGQVQGYFISYPLGAPEIRALLAGRAEWTASRIESTEEPRTPSDLRRPDAGRNIAGLGAFPMVAATGAQPAHDSSTLVPLR